MRVRSKLIAAAVALVTVLAVLAGGVVGISPASAADPGFEPDSNMQGSITFYNASGTVVTSGNDLNHLFDYAVASSAASRPTTKATLFFAFPDHTKADSSTWAAAAGSASTNYPNSSAPAPVNAATTPTVTLVRPTATWLARSVRPRSTPPPATPTWFRSD